MFVLGGVDMMYIRYIISSKARHMHSCQQLGILLASNLNRSKMPLLVLQVEKSAHDGLAYLIKRYETRDVFFVFRGIQSIETYPDSFCPNHITGFYDLCITNKLLPRISFLQFPLFFTGSACCIMDLELEIKNEVQLRDLLMQAPSEDVGKIRSYS